MLDRLRSLSDTHQFILDPDSYEKKNVRNKDLNLNNTDIFSELPLDLKGCLGQCKPLHNILGLYLLFNVKPATP